MNGTHATTTPTALRGPRWSRQLLGVATTGALVFGLASCGSDDGDASNASTETAGEDSQNSASEAESNQPLVIYSGRNEELVAPILEDLESELGVEVQVRYGDTAELAAQLLEEGERTDADLFFSQDAGALGALVKADLLAPLDADTVAEVDERYRDSDDRWVATSARARVITYDSEQVSEADLPSGVDELLDPAWEGRVGFAPTNASFHAFVTALRVDRGEDGARTWLEDFAATNPQAYENNTAVLEAVDRGEVALGLINHYYWHQRVAELGEDEVTARIHFLNTNDPGALVNVAGVGVLAPSDNQEAANAAVSYFLSESGQQYFADETAEYAVIDGVSSTSHDLPPLDDLDGHQIDLNDLDTLDETLVLLDSVGLT